eukprot:TRINITY_DN33933_c0_g1_i1.p4 TRINITY_DN33933_c0_g1~~TRINITY_DN33933_c0_g1_i1.p4  ORF type:complete len:101 (+),score=34.54 TRINITY_DN33933_c0_g1_i1:89-391(+)
MAGGLRVPAALIERNCGPDATADGYEGCVRRVVYGFAATEVLCRSERLEWVSCAKPHLPNPPDDACGPQHEAFEQCVAARAAPEAERRMAAGDPPHRSVR